jgi:superfamily I DNA/RNA helicase
MVQPTDEQALAIEKFQTRRPLKIAAFAGTGKTSTLIFMARSRQSKGLYLAFNKAIAAEAKSEFPATVTCRTVHSLAYGSVARSYRPGDKLVGTLNAPTLAASARRPVRNFGADLSLNSLQQAHLVLGTIKRFCQSTDPEILSTHVPQYGRLLAETDSTVAEVRSWAVSAATAIWRRMIDRDDDLPMGHDGYLKLWALGKPRLNAEYILLDEAQDTNEVVLGALQSQKCQVVYVGDRYQQIYEWRGAVNAMEKVVGCEETSLTQSFRFGSSIARAASLVLEILGEKESLRGNPKVDSTLTEDRVATRAVLARTNATVIVELLNAMNQRQRPCIVGGTSELARLLGDVERLKQGSTPISTEFFGFTRWSDVVEFSRDEEGESIRSLVQLVEQYGERRLLLAVNSAREDENGADVVFSTAHKAKGREWDSVRLAGDFAKLDSKGNRTHNEAESRLFYVAMTRAKRVLVVSREQLTHFTIRPGTGSAQKRWGRVSRSTKL